MVVEGALSAVTAQPTERERGCHYCQNSSTRILLGENGCRDTFSGAESWGPGFGDRQFQPAIIHSLAFCRCQVCGGGLGFFLGGGRACRLEVAHQASRPAKISTPKLRQLGGTFEISPPPAVCETVSDSDTLLGCAGFCMLELCGVDWLTR